MFNSHKKKFLLIIFYLICSSQTLATTPFTTEIALENRIFFEEPAYPGQIKQYQTSLSIRPEMDWNIQNFHFAFEGFYRWDADDRARTKGDVGVLYVQYQQKNWDVLVGINKVFWGVTESRHLVDVINQVDVLEDIDQEDKLGQVMLQLRSINEWGLVSLYFLPRFEVLEFWSESSRYRLPILIDNEIFTFESDDVHKHKDWAFRYSHVVGSIDMGLSYFYGTSREPRFLYDFTRNLLVQRYDLMKQTSLDLQFTGEDLLIKFEGIYRETNLENFLAAVFGFEYTFYQINTYHHDLGIMVEYLWDDRSALSPGTSFNDDLFMGTRWTLNDMFDSQLLTGFVVDLNHHQLYLSVEYQRRLNENWSIESSLRAITNASDNDPLFFAKRDDHIRIELKRFF